MYGEVSPYIPPKSFLGCYSVMMEYWEEGVLHSLFSNEFSAAMFLRGILTGLLDAVVIEGGRIRRWTKIQQEEKAPFINKVSKYL